MYVVQLHILLQFAKYYAVGGPSETISSIICSNTTTKPIPIQIPQNSQDF